MAARNDDGLYAKARSLFISKATMDDLTGRATPRQTDAASRPFDTEPANGERSKRERLLRRARFPVVKSLDGYDFSNVRLPDGYALGLRGRQARGRDHRQDRASWTPARVHRAEPPRQRGAHVRKDVRRTRVRTQGEDKGTGRNAPWLKSKFFRDQSRNADSTKYAASPALRPPPEAPLCTRRCPRRPSN